MVCDFYIQTELVIEYIDVSGARSKTFTDRQIKRYTISSVPDEDSDDDMDTYREKYENEVQRQMHSHEKVKILYNADQWIKSSYRKRYESYVLNTCPRMEQLVSVKKTTIAFKHH